MGIEYAAKVDQELTVEVASEIISRVSSSHEWFPLLIEPGKATFSFLETPINPSWPDDLRLEIDGHEIYVVFHGGPRYLEQRFLDTLCDVLVTKGIHCRFEEL